MRLTPPRGGSLCFCVREDSGRDVGERLGRLNSDQGVWVFEAVDETRGERLQNCGGSKIPKVVNCKGSEVSVGGGQSIGEHGKAEVELLTEIAQSENGRAGCFWIAVGGTAHENWNGGAGVATRASHGRKLVDGEDLVRGLWIRRDGHEFANSTFTKAGESAEGAVGSVCILVFRKTKEAGCCGARIITQERKAQQGGVAYFVRFNGLDEDLLPEVASEFGVLKQHCPLERLFFIPETLQEPWDGVGADVTHGSRGFFLSCRRSMPPPIHWHVFFCYACVCLIGGKPFGKGAPSVGGLVVRDENK